MKQKYNNILKATRLLALVALMAFGAIGICWGQGNRPSKPTRDQLEGLLRDLNNKNAPVTKFLDYVENGVYAIENPTEEEDSYRQENNTYIYDIKWNSWQGITNDNSSNYTISNYTDNILGKRTIPIYAKQGETKDLFFQDGNTPNAIDGYICWYVEENNNRTITNLSLSGSDDKVRSLKGGLIWLRAEDFVLCMMNNSRNVDNWYISTTWTRWENVVSAPAAIGTVKYKVPDNATVGSVIRVICEASSDNNIFVNGNTVTPPEIAVQNIYEIHIVDDDSRLPDPDKINPFSGNAGNVTLIQEARDNPETYFLDYFEIHTPIPTGTNYRLDEPVSNYYVKANDNNIYAANNVRWRMFKDDGSAAGGQYTDKNGNKTTTSEVTGNNRIVKYKFPVSTNETQTLVYYLTAEVQYRDDNTSSDWYPIICQKVYLEPFSEPLTQNELDEKGNDYFHRTEKYLIDNRYERIGYLSFEDNTISQQQLNIESNFTTTTLANMNSSYAFANVASNTYRKENRVSVGRGEYALYRTLNKAGISNNDVTYKGGHYNDWFMSNGKYKNTYVVDRTWDKTKGTKVGSFMYLDATDEPGIITRIDIDNLCPHTSLLVKAWICDMGYSDEAKCEHADVGFTFKKIIDGKEEILSKYYSGIVSNKPAVDSDTENNPVQQAQWQQICFEFTFPEGSSEDKYILEIANNTPSSDGADYAIDDIEIYRSTPDIRVQRRNACDASTLLLSSDYQTILRNMGWDEGQNILIDYKEELTNNEDIRKYRYGLMGEDPENPNYVLNSVVGNVYFAFYDDNKKEWVTINKTAENHGVTNASKAIRIPVSTVQGKENGFEFFTTDEAQAQIYERTMNIRAINDYNSDLEKGLWEGKDTINTAEIDKNIYAYQYAIEKLYKITGVPRIRCPWYVDGKLYLSSIDVNNTDLKYKGQDGASGEYLVMSFSAGQIVNSSNPGQEIDPEAPCALVSSFTVWAASDILIEASAEAETALCSGGYRKITPSLLVYDDNGLVEDENELEKILGEYIFDWYLSSSENYDRLTDDFINTYPNILTDEEINQGVVKAAINAYRGAGNKDVITSDKIITWRDSNSANERIQLFAELLLDLLNPDGDGETDDSLLRTGTPAGEVLNMQVFSSEIMAMPFVQAKEGYLFCTAATPVTIPMVENDIPVVYLGYTTTPEGIKLGDEALRLGRVNMNNETTLTLPVRDFDKMAENAYFGLAKETVPIQLDDEELNYPEVGIATFLEIKKEASNAKVTISLNHNNAKTYLHEGDKYNILIPFVQKNEENNEILASECDGWISLPVKIVPEYLTWQGGNWYNDENWNQSTKAEIYVRNDNTDANGNDDVSDAFTPLYFTKITIPGGNELSLLEPIYAGENNKTITNLEEGYTIQYDMAVDKETDGSIKVVPYYINKVDQIYFKPGATLLNQHLLTYNKARVDFEMTKGQPYWMSSPLKDVYAGDMYAPAGTGRQETPAFEDITYDDGTNSRWGLPFYQKAWNKAVSYKTEAGEVNVSVVQSNWSIEYNDVWVPYTVGKGFYSRVENKNANNNVLVRLPKEDTDYTYEKPKTKGLSTFPTGGKDDSGKLHTDGTTDGTITLDLSSVDGDGNHFLIGNPYMAYLDMSKFFNEGNKAVLGEKYWIIDNEGNASVGTPDVVWGDGMKSGYIAPMQAFFVEHKDYTPNETKSDTEVPTPAVVTFNINMTVSQDEATNQNPGTRAFKATNPQLTILAKGAEGKSVSFVVQSDFAENVYMSDEDAVALLDSELKIPMVYTVAGNCAAAVNKVKDMQNIPLGVYAEEDEEVEVTIEGMSQFVDSLYLHDALTGKSVLLDGDIYTLRVNGENHGRYTITTKGGITVESNICVYSPSSNNLMIAASPSETLEQVRVFDMSGRMVENRVDLESSNCRLRVASGIYIVYAKTEAGETKVKVRVK